jgi:hypothetical protein
VGLNERYQPDSDNWRYNPPAMYCPKCGDSLKDQHGVFRCERGRMELSQLMAERLYSGFVNKTEERGEESSLDSILIQGHFTVLADGWRDLSIALIFRPVSNSSERNRKEVEI